MVKITRFSVLKTSNGQNAHKTLTPPNVERTGCGETLRDDLQNVNFGRLIGLEGIENGLQCGCADAKENQNVDDQELVITSHDEVVQGR